MSGVSREVKMDMKIALLIDAENISHKYSKQIFDEASRYGSVICKRIYGDWSSASLSSWRSAITDYSIHAIQQFQNTSGKNSSDSALIIDAMDLLHDDRYECFCIISSDSDFTRLASRLRESEKYVVGMGEQKAPVSFRNACDKYIFLDLLSKSVDASNATNDNNSANATNTPNATNTGNAINTANATNNGNTTNDTKEPDISPESSNIPDSAANDVESKNGGLNLQTVIETIKEIVLNESDDDGWIFLGDLGDRLSKKLPDFDTRNFGFDKLTKFIASTGKFKIDSRPAPKAPNIKHNYIALK